MSKYLSQFKTCGQNVIVAEDAYIEHPEALEVGDDVTFMKGFYMIGEPKVCRIGPQVTFFPNCFIQGSPERFIVEEHVGFYPGMYMSLGSGPASVFEVGHHSHFAAGCAIYSAGGLKLGPYCNIAAHCVLTTIGHHHEIVDKPMAQTGAKAGPITLVEDVWLGANVTITMGVTLGKGCVIGANAVVTRDTEPMGIYVGVPARLLRKRP